VRLARLAVLALLLQARAAPPLILVEDGVFLRTPPVEPSTRCTTGAG